MSACFENRVITLSTEQPSVLLRRLAKQKTNCIVELALPAHSLRVWLDQGRVVWLERVPSRGELALLLCEFLGIKRDELRALTTQWRANGVTLLDGLLGQPGTTLEAIRQVLRGYFIERFRDIENVPFVQCKSRPFSDSPSNERLRFTVDELIGARVEAQPGDEPMRTLRSDSGCNDAPNDSLPPRAIDAQDARVVVAGRAEQQDSIGSWLEWVDSTLWSGRSRDDSERVIIASSETFWSGWTTNHSRKPSSFWFRYAASGTTLGSVVRMLDELAPPIRLRPSLALVSASRQAENAGWQEESWAQRAFELGEGYRCAYLVRAGKVIHRRCSVVANPRSAEESVTRAARVLDRASLATPQGSSTFVLLYCSDGYHLGAQVDPERAFFMTFPPDHLQGLALYAVRAGAESLRAHESM